MPFHRPMAPVRGLRFAPSMSKLLLGVSVGVSALALNFALPAQAQDFAVDVNDPSVSVDLSVLNDGGLSPQMGAPLPSGAGAAAPALRGQAPGADLPVSTLYIEPQGGASLPPQTKALIAKPAPEPMPEPDVEVVEQAPVSEPMAEAAPAEEAPAQETPTQETPAQEAADAMTPPPAPDLAEPAPEAQPAPEVASAPQPEPVAEPAPQPAPAVTAGAPAAPDTAPIAEVRSEPVPAPETAAPAEVPAETPPPPQALSAEPATPPAPPSAAPVADETQTAPMPAAPAPTAPSAVVDLPPKPGEDTPGVASLPPASGPLTEGDTMRIVFEGESSKLPPEARDALKTLTERMAAQENLRLQLLAYAGDAQTSASAARRLSLSRALAVRSFLIENGLRSTRIDVRALGNKSTDTVTERVDLTVVER